MHSSRSRSRGRSVLCCAPCKSIVRALLATTLLPTHPSPAKPLRLLSKRLWSWTPRYFVRAYLYVRPATMGNRTVKSPPPENSKIIFESASQSFYPLTENLRPCITSCTFFAGKSENNRDRDRRRQRVGTRRDVFRQVIAAWRKREWRQRLRHARAKINQPDHHY